MARNVWMRWRLAYCTASKQRSMSCSRARARPQIVMGTPSRLCSCRWAEGRGGHDRRLKIRATDKHDNVVVCRFAYARATRWHEAFDEFKQRGEELKLKAGRHEQQTRQYRWLRCVPSRLAEASGQLGRITLLNATRLASNV